MTILYAPHTSTDALRRARGWVGKSYPVGWCQKWVVAEIFGTGGVGDWDGDGAADAEDGWKAAVRDGRAVPASQIADYREIPGGVALYWSGGRNDNGHAAVSAEKGSAEIYSTDQPYTGKIGRVLLSRIHSSWGLTFLGYVTKTGNGFTLTDPPSVTPATVFDLSNWNPASERWFPIKWASRSAGISEEILGSPVREDGSEASVHTFQEIYAAEQIATIQKALGANFTQVSGTSGRHAWYDVTKWDYSRPGAKVNYELGPQGRGVTVFHLGHRKTGREISFVLCHAPALVPAYRVTYGARVRALVEDVDRPRILVGDWNNSSADHSPRRDIEALGFRSMRAQADIVHEPEPEFPEKNVWLAEIYTRPAEAKILSGINDRTSARLSDHRRIEARISVS